MRAVVNKSDVVLQVLDARDPAGCRSAALEESILAFPDKRLVLVMLMMKCICLHSPTLRNTYIFAIRS